MTQCICLNILLIFADIFQNYFFLFLKKLFFVKNETKEISGGVVVTKWKLIAADVFFYMKGKLRFSRRMNEIKRDGREKKKKIIFIESVSFLQK